MFQDQTVIACIPAGRRRYMRCGLPYLVNDPVVDEVWLWVNTDVADDLLWMQQARDHYGKVRLVDGPGSLQKTRARDGHTQFNDGVARFYSLCTRSDTTYLKLDDDIVWYAPDFVQQMCESLHHNPAPALVLANCVNTPHPSFRHHYQGLFGVHSRMVFDNPRCHATFMDGDFACYIHQCFLAYAQRDQWQPWLYDDHDVGPGHTRIGAIAWRGDTFARFGGLVQSQGDEPDLTVRVPAQLGMPLRYAGQALCSHYASGHQESALNQDPRILAGYEQESRRRNGELL